MYGWLTVDGKRRKAAPVRVFLCGLPLWKAEGSSGPRGLQRAAKALAKAGARQIIAPEGEEIRAALDRYGLRPVDTAGLCRAAAAPLALTALTLRGWDPARAVVELRGSGLTLPLVRTAETLAGRVCRLVIAVPRGGDALADHLRRTYGLPVLLPGSVRPALAVEFDPCGQGKGPTLRLWGERPELLGAEVGDVGVEPPPGCPSMPLLAALWESGLLSADELYAREGKSAESGPEYPLTGENKGNIILR